MGTFQNIFGGGTISPAQVSYVDYVLTAPIVLVWPLETQPNSTLAGQIIDIDIASTGSFSLTLPPANQVSVGQFVIVNNKSAFNQAVLNASGSTVIAALAPGAIYFLYLTNNTTSPGIWSAFQYGAQASAPSAAGLAGAGLLATGSTLSQDIPVVSLNSPFSVGVPNRAQLLNWTGGSGTITLPLAATAQPSFYIQVRNSGTSILTIATSGSDTINGAASISMNPGDSAFVVTDGTTWITLGLGPILTANFNFIVINVPSVVVGNIVTLSGTQLNQIAYRFTGALTANTIVDLPAVKQQYWVDNETTGAFILTFQVPTVTGGPTPAGATVAVPQGSRIIMYTDGANVLNASTGGIAIPVAVNQGGTGSTTAGGALINLGGTTTGIAVFTAANAAAAQAAIAAPSTADAVVLAMVL
jgi:hypothetical protein